MLLLVLILVLVAFGLLVVALLTQSVLWAWVSVAVSVAAAVVLLIDWLLNRSVVRAGTGSSASRSRAPEPAPEAPGVPLEVATEVLPLVPPGAGPMAVRGRAEPTASDSQQTIALPTVQPSGSSGLPSGAPDRTTSSGGSPLRSVTKSGSSSGPSSDPGTPAERGADRAGGDDPAWRDPAGPSGDVEATATVDARSGGSTSGPSVVALPARATNGATARVPGRPGDDHRSGDDHAPVPAAGPDRPSAVDAPDDAPDDDGSGDAGATDTIRAGADIGAADRAAADRAADRGGARAGEPRVEERGGTGSGSRPAAAVPPAVPPVGAAPSTGDQVPDADATADQDLTAFTAEAGGSGSTAAVPARGTTARRIDDGPVGDDLFSPPPRTERVDEEPPEEERDARAAALVAELDDEVVVIDEKPRYHVLGCRALTAVAVIPLPAREAVELGFTPCGWCTPDRSLAERHPAAAR